MIINKDVKARIHSIWDTYIADSKKVYDTKGNEFSDIDAARLEATQHLEQIISQFSSKQIDIHEFKTSIDSFNKRNNLWGFTAVKGQMFFNQLVKSNEATPGKLTALLIEAIALPSNLSDALSKINKLEESCKKIFIKAQDKRKVPNPGSVGYFLSYFWHIHHPEKWPILYTSQINAYMELGIWEEKITQKETYEYFYKLNEEIKKILADYTGKNISNWDVEHAFWNFKGNPNKQVETKKEKVISPELQEPTKIAINASFDLTDYLIPKVAKLVELGNDVEKSSSAKGREFERLVAEIFSLLDFEVDLHGQGSGRNPDAIVKFREEHTAFIVDAKAYSTDYSLGLDDRPIREYINYHIPKLKREGFTRIGFIIVSNSFKSNFDSFINEITWSTDIKRFVLLTSEALLYLLAYKTKDRHTLSLIIEKLIGFGNPILSQDVISEFDDV